MSIHAYPRHSSTTNLDMDGPWQQLGPRHPHGLVAAQTAQFSMALVEAWPLDTNMVSGGKPNPGHRYGPQTLTWPKVSTQTLGHWHGLQRY